MGRFVLSVGWLGRIQNLDPLYGEEDDFCILRFQTQGVVIHPGEHAAHDLAQVVVVVVAAASFYLY